MTQSTTTYSRGDVVVIAYPFAELDVIKNRPALILSSDDFRASRQDVVVAAITSRIRSPMLAGDYVLQDWREAGLLRPSVVTGILRTAKAYRILRRLGRVSAEDLKSYEAELRSSLSL